MSGTPTTAPAYGPMKTPEGIAKYAFLHTPRVNKKAKPGTAARYSIKILFPIGADLLPMKKAAVALAIEKLGRDKVSALLKDGKLNMGIRTDLASQGDDDTVFQAYIQPWSNDAPGVVDRFRGPDGKALPIRDKNVIYDGAKVIAQVNPFWYDNEGNKGVSWGLNFVQKTGEGAKIGTRGQDVNDVFQATEDAPDDMQMGSAPAGGQQYSDSAPAAGASTQKGELADLLG